MRLSVNTNRRVSICFFISFAAITAGCEEAKAANDGPQTGPAVKDIRRLKRGLNTGFELMVENLPPPAEDEHRTDWVLYFDGLPVDNMTPTLPEPTALPDYNSSSNRPPNTVFQFEFEHEDADQAWRNLFARAGFFRGSSLTVGPRLGPSAVKAMQVPFKTLMIPGRRLFAAALFYLVLLIIIVVLAQKSKLLKEDSGRGAAVFSLGRTQMAFWFFVVLGAYLFIGVMTGTWDGTIGTQALALMGISATTGIAAAVVGSEKRHQMSSAPVQTKDLATLQATLQAAIANPTNAANVPVLVEQLRAVGGQVAQLAAIQAMSPTAPQKGIGFWRNLASDKEGIALHRFQVIVWTVVLGAVFLVRVLTDLVMPELDPTTLALMGISSGTYLGFKFPEKA